MAKPTISVINSRARLLGCNRQGCSRLSFLLSAPALIELALVATLLLAAWLLPAATIRRLAAAETRALRLPTSLGMQLAFIGLFAVLIRAAFLPWLGPPVPLIPDEYSLLLQAQTFMEWRLANPTHPFWQHFQAMHVNQVPAYASMYFPGRGLPLALGLLLADEPWLGIWASFVLFAMGTVWMLRGWVGPKAALAGGMLVVLRLGAGSYWVNSYWGGALTAFGAMLVFGALPRLIRRPSWGGGIVLGLGAMILLITRPFEGGALCAALGLFFGPRLLKTGLANVGRFAARAGLPLAAGVALGGGFILQYNEATTGDPLLTPYAVNREQYASVPAFLIQAPVDRQPPSDQLPGYFEAVYEVESENYFAARRSLGELISFEVVKIRLAGAFYIGFAMALPFLIGLWVSRRDLPVVGTAIVVFANHLLTSWHFPHYAAPLFPVFLLITIRGLVVLGRWSVQDRPAGYLYSRGAFIAAASPNLLLALHLTTGWPKDINNSWNEACCAVRQTSEHEQLRDRLVRSPGQDLVLVKHNEFFLPYGDIVYNEPDIDRAAVVFAHSLSEPADARLLDYFADRRLWRLEFTAGGYSLEPLVR